MLTMILNSNCFKYDSKFKLNIIKYYNRVIFLFHMLCSLEGYLEMIFIIYLKLWLINLKMMGHLNNIECGAVDINSSGMSCIKSVPTRGYMCLNWNEFLEIAFSCGSYVKENVSFEFSYQNVYYCSK
jgi:hypothetical protein